MTMDEARQRIRACIDQYGALAAVPLDLLLNEIRSSLGNETANELIDEFDLELQYNIMPLEHGGSNY